MAAHPIFLACSVPVACSAKISRVGTARVAIRFLPESLALFPRMRWLELRRN